MAPVLVAAGLVVAALPALGRPVGRRIATAEWAKLCLAALVGGALAVEAGAVLVAVPTVLRAAGAPALAQACGRLVHPLLPLGAAGGWLAAALALAVPMLAVQGWRRATAAVRALAIDGCLGRHERRGGYELVVLPTPEQLAYSVTDPIPQVVVSQGLADALTAAELSAVIDHERAHLGLGHQRLLLVAAAARRSLVFWPPAGRSHAALRAAMERWADDTATGGDRQRRADLRQALVTVAIADVAGPVPAFSLADATLERVEALEREPRAPLALHLLLYVPGSAGAATAAVAIGGWASEVRHVLAMAGRCTV